MEFRKTEEADEAAVMAMIDEAKAYFRRQGINQWQDGYPNPQTLRQDNAAGVGHCLAENGRPVAYGAIIFGTEPTYARLDGGRWLQNGPYGVVHRTVVQESQKGKSLAGRLLAEAEAMARARGIADLRVDTHRDNRSMRRMLEKNGFTCVGTIYLENGDPRVAYEKVLP